MIGRENLSKIKGKKTPGKAQNYKKCLQIPSFSALR
jgi:hypothetical protein